MARFKILDSGRRQILAFHFPGDFVDLESCILRQMDYGISALTDAETAIVQHNDLREIIETQPHLTRLLWLSTLTDAAICRQWAVAASMAANRHFAHLICETYTRLVEAGIARDFRFEMPMSQEVIAEAMGLTTVHVSRIAHELRERHLVEWKRPVLIIPDWSRLAAFGGFDPQYLQSL